MANKDYNYTNFEEAPYDKLLNRESELTYQFGQQVPGTGQGKVMGSGNDDGTTQGQGGSVATVALKSEGNATDVWILNFIRSMGWKPKKIGFYIDGQTGYAEFANVYISGTIVVTFGTIGGFKIGPDYIRDALNTMGMASTVTGADDVRFWAGDTFDNRSIAPFRVLESGKLFATDVEITGGTIDGAVITNLSGVTDPTIIPDTLGQIYVNTALGRIFMSIGTTDSNDWVLLESARLPREIPGTVDNITITDVPTMGGGSSISVFTEITVTDVPTVAAPA